MTFDYVFTDGCFIPCSRAVSGQYGVTGLNIENFDLNYSDYIDLTHDTG